MPRAAGGRSTEHLPGARGRGRTPRPAPARAAVSPGAVTLACPCRRRRSFRLGRQDAGRPARSRRPPPRQAGFPPHRPPLRPVGPASARRRSPRQADHAAACRRRGSCPTPTQSPPRVVRRSDAPARNGQHHRGHDRPRRADHHRSPSPSAAMVDAAQPPRPEEVSRQAPRGGRGPYAITSSRFHVLHNAYSRRPTTPPRRHHTNGPVGSPAAATSGRSSVAGRDALLRATGPADRQPTDQQVGRGRVREREWAGRGGLGLGGDAMHRHVRPAPRAAPAARKLNCASRRAGCDIAHSEHDGSGVAGPQYGQAGISPSGARR